MDGSNDFLDNVRSFGTTPPFHKVEVIRNEIIYIPDRENYPVYWEKRDQEDKDACKLRCSYKKGFSEVIDCMKEKGVFLNLEEFSIMNSFPLDVTMKTVEENYFEIYRSELIVLSPYFNITPFVYHQLIKSYPNKDRQNYTHDTMCCMVSCKSEQGNGILLLRSFLDHENRIIISWQDYVAFLRERDFDIPQYTIPGY